MSQTTNPAPEAPALPPDSVSLTIDGRTVVAKKGTLVVEAAKQIGEEIPVFCYHPKMKPVGACRMCLVQIEKMPRLQTACTTPVAQDMVVHTRSPETRDAQNAVIELLLANHPLDCPICDKGGECPLQDNTFTYGRGVSRFTEEKRHLEKAYPLGERIVLDRERCIMCYRCVRFHQEITGDEALAALDRGSHTEIGTLPGESYSSIFSGNTVELCPVGALTSRQYRFRARPWDLVKTPSVCNGCSVGCNVQVHSRIEHVLRLVSRENPAVDDGWLCDRGRFDTMPAAQDLRAPRPLLRSSSDAALEPAPWRDALARVCTLVGEQQGRLGVLASPSLSNEALWLLHHELASRGGAVPAALWPPVGGGWPVKGSIADVPKSKTVVLVGLDAWNELPVLALWIRRAVQHNGAKLVVIGAANGLVRDTDHWLRAPSGWEPQVAAAIQATLATPGSAQPVGDVSAAEIAAAAATLGAHVGQGPVTFLVGPHLAAAESSREALMALAQTLGANAGGGLVGAPGLAANARGALEIAPELLKRRAADVLAAVASGELTHLLLLGDEAWGELDTGSARLLVATARPVPNDPRVDVVLPLAHPYERQGSVTNLEGRVQFQEGGAVPPAYARADWALLANLAAALGSSVPTRLADLRAAMVAEKPAWAEALAGADELRPFMSGLDLGVTTGEMGYTGRVGIYGGRPE